MVKEERVGALRFDVIVDNADAKKNLSDTVKHLKKAQSDIDKVERAASTGLTSQRAPQRHLEGMRSRTPFMQGRISQLPRVATQNIMGYKSKMPGLSKLMGPRAILAEQALKLLGKLWEATKDLAAQIKKSLEETHKAITKAITKGIKDGNEARDVMLKEMKENDPLRRSEAQLGLRLQAAAPTEEMIQRHKRLADAQYKLNLEWQSMINTLDGVWTAVNYLVTQLERLGTFLLKTGSQAFQAMFHLDMLGKFMDLLPDLPEGPAEPTRLAGRLRTPNTVSTDEQLWRHLVERQDMMLEQEEREWRDRMLELQEQIAAEKYNEEWLGNWGDKIVDKAPWVIWDIMQWGIQGI